MQAAGAEGERCASCRDPLREDWKELVRCRECGRGFHKRCLGMDPARFVSGALAKCADCLGGSSERGRELVTER